MDYHRPPRPADDGAGGDADGATVDSEGSSSPWEGGGTDGLWWSSLSADVELTPSPPSSGLAILRHRVEPCGRGTVSCERGSTQSEERGQDAGRVGDDGSSPSRWRKPGSCGGLPSGFYHRRVKFTGKTRIQVSRVVKIVLGILSGVERPLLTANKQIKKEINWQENDTCGGRRGEGGNISIHDKMSLPWMAPSRAPTGDTTEEHHRCLPLWLLSIKWI